MSEPIEQVIEQANWELRNAGKKGLLTVRINSKDFDEMVDRLSAKVNPATEDAPEYVQMHATGGMIRVYPDTETPEGIIDIDSQALEPA